MFQQLPDPFAGIPAFYRKDGTHALCCDDRIVGTKSLSQSAVCHHSNLMIKKWPNKLLQLALAMSKQL